MEDLVSHAKLANTFGPRAFLRKKRDLGRSVRFSGVIEVRNSETFENLSPSVLLREYTHIFTTVEQLNRFSAAPFLQMHACSYIQMISDVFQLIQILRIPEASISDAIFFAEDM